MRQMQPGIVEAVAGEVQIGGAPVGFAGHAVLFGESLCYRSLLPCVDSIHQSKVSYVDGVHFSAEHLAYWIALSELQAREI
jgi:hypothetical protein